MKALVVLLTMMFSVEAPQAQTLHAEIPSHGDVLLVETSSGLQTEMTLSGNPGERYQLKFQSNCQRATAPWQQHRHTFEIYVDMNSNKLFQKTVIFPGVDFADLRARNLNTLALFRRENAYWKLVSCVSIDQVREFKWEY